MNVAKQYYRGKKLGNPSALSKHQRGREDQGDSADNAREKLTKILLEMGRTRGVGGGGGDL